MATLNKTRISTRNQKKGVCVMAVELVPADYVASADVIEFGEMPENALITDIHLYVETSFTGNSASAATLLIKLDAVTIGGTAANIFSAAGTRAITTAQVLTGAGGKLTGTVVFTGGVPDAGKAHLLVEYVEYTKNTGEYTDYSTT